MSGAIVVVAYPRTDKSTFNKDYYISTHIPLVEKTWKPFGLKSWTVGELTADGPYSFTVVFEFESLEAFGKAIQDPGTKAVMEDVANFSSEQPVLLRGGVIARG
ncbi:hypothetical protein IAQ61_004055 [Plenodomus lingam]|uniref:Similar to ethyl tert-butyl ether degradation ethD n=1 Tax=Leptosphaeria maculans (strain JN3 / isolate v23.1.3 / race Av1-4-5-6-7-8) TaxID=985895 RepID=E4ZX21_LEPMJ|nr:similar to ethyl tert-butyl ether degradation ethD [Plenodomus lingam JN3]KAH9873432.1 hypothetical protein IAQ61_004055 [Plenodomus lingam]CBX95231.1 similar to ethyl tert-butyl ether degradation ethD [Plenodomus lingam JN3]